MTFKQPHFGGDIVTNPNKTTTLIGKKIDVSNGGGTQSIIDSGLYNSRENLGVLNVLNITDNISDLSDTEIWNLHNKPWMDQAALRNDDIRAVSNPLNNDNIYIDGDPNLGLSFFWHGG